MSTCAGVFICVYVGMRLNVCVSVCVCARVVVCVCVCLCVCVILLTGITPFAQAREVSLFVRKPVMDQSGRYDRLLQFPEIPAPAIS